MSYEIVKAIRIKDGRVFLKSDSNNVWPRDYHEWECPSLTAILERDGQEALDIEILRTYESGSFQGSANKYTHALMILRHMPEYDNFNWRVCGDDWDKRQETRKSQACRELLKKALTAKLPKQRFLIKKQEFGGMRYLHPKTRRRVFWIPEKDEAKVFYWQEDAVSMKGNYYNSDHWQIEAV